MKDKIKQILQQEINYHQEEMIKHRQQEDLTGSIKQKQKKRKHFHKKYQTIKIAKELGYDFCQECGSLK